MDIFALALLAASLSAEIGVPSDIILGVCHRESTFKNISIVDSNGRRSLGICQVQLAAANTVSKYSTSEKLMEPKYNMRIAAKYLRYQYNRHGSWAKAISAYNAGKPIKGNTAYVNSVLCFAKHYKRLPSTYKIEPTDYYLKRLEYCRQGTI